MTNKRILENIEETIYIGYDTVITRSSIRVDQLSDSIKKSLEERRSRLQNHLDSPHNE